VDLYEPVINEAPKKKRKGQPTMGSALKG